MKARRLVPSPPHPENTAHLLGRGRPPRDADCRDSTRRHLPAEKYLTGFFAL